MSTRQVGTGLICLFELLFELYTILLTFWTEIQLFFQSQLRKSQKDYVFSKPHQLTWRHISSDLIASICKTHKTRHNTEFKNITFKKTKINSGLYSAILLISVSFSIRIAGSAYMSFVCCLWGVVGASSIPTSSGDLEPLKVATVRRFIHTLLFGI